MSALYYGSNKNRYSATFNPTTRQIERVRCIQGHSADVTPEDADWIPINIEEYPRLFHVTYPHCVAAMADNGLIPARLNTSMPIGGRAEIYLKPYDTMNTRQVSPRPGCTVMCIAATELCAEITFYRTLKVRS